MKLIIVEHSKLGTFARLSEKFVDDPNVKVVLERRQRNTDAGRGASERRRLRKLFEGRDWIVVHTADETSETKIAEWRSGKATRSRSLK